MARQERFMTARGPLGIGVVIGNARLWEEAQGLLRLLPVRVVFEMAQAATEDALFARIDRFKPDVVLIDPSALPLGLNELIPLIKALPVSPLVVVVRETATAEEIIRAMRAGADEFVLPPLESGWRPRLPPGRPPLRGPRARRSASSRRKPAAAERRWPATPPWSWPG
jgi:CheY-like chemotaxis protein